MGRKEVAGTLTGKKMRRKPAGKSAEISIPSYLFMGKTGRSSGGTATETTSARREVDYQDVPDMKPEEGLPKTVDEAVDYLLAELSAEQKEILRKVTNPIDLHFGLGMDIRNELGLLEGNPELLEACRRPADPEYLVDPDGASMVIIEALLERLRGE